MTQAPEVGMRMSLAALRDHLQDDCRMLQIWGGTTVDKDNYQVFISQDLEYYAIISAPSNDEMFTVILAGNISYLHEKNIRTIMEDAKRIRKDIDE